MRFWPLVRAPRALSLCIYSLYVSIRASEGVTVRNGGLVAPLQGCRCASWPGSPGRPPRHRPCGWRRPPIYASMITAYRAWLTRRQGSRIEGRKLPARSLGISRSRSPTWVVRLRGRSPSLSPVRSWRSAPSTTATSSSISCCSPWRASSGIAHRQCCHPVAAPSQLRHDGSWAWSVWLSWFSKQGNGPAHPLQRQPWSRIA